MPGSEATRGCLILVVGPSGVGKDSIVAGLRRRLRHDPSFRFPRRYITRPARAGSEGHHEVSQRRFDAMRADGAFLLSWQAHSYAYGIGLDAADALDRGINVLVNASRSIIQLARAELQPVRVLMVTAAEATLRERLEQRGRENPKQVAQRLARANAFDIAGADVTRLSNDGALGDTVERALREVIRLTAER